MIKPPSLQHEFSLVWSKDPALKLPDDPEEAARLLKQARETGQWDALIAEGQQPTVFHFRDLTRTEIGWWRGEIGQSTSLGRPLSDIETVDLLIRISLRSIDNFGTHKVKRLQVSAGVQLVDVSTIEAIYECAGPQPLAEFADLILERLREPHRPLS